MTYNQKISYRAISAFGYSYTDTAYRWDFEYRMLNGVLKKLNIPNPKMILVAKMNPWLVFSYTKGNQKMESLLWTQRYIKDELSKINSNYVIVDMVARKIITDIERLQSYCHGADLHENLKFINDYTFMIPERPLNATSIEALVNNVLPPERSITPSPSTESETERSDDLSSTESETERSDDLSSTESKTERSDDLSSTESETE